MSLDSAVRVQFGWANGGGAQARDWIKTEICLRDKGWKSHTRNGDQPKVVRKKYFANGTRRRVEWDECAGKKCTSCGNICIGREERDFSRSHCHLPKPELAS